MYSPRVGVTLSPELLEAARSGDRTAYNQVGKWLIDELFVYYRGQGRPRDEIAELSQDAALRIVNKLEQAPREPELFRAWTIGVARMVAKEDVTRHARHKGKQAAIGAQPRTPARRPNSILAFRRLLAWVRGELQKLSSPYDRTFELMLDRDKRDDVAEELDVPDGTVRRRVWWVRRRIGGARDRNRRTSQRHRT